MSVTLLSVDFLTTGLKWRPNTLSKTLNIKYFKSPVYFPSSSSISSSVLNLKSHYHQASPQTNSTKHTTLLVETFHENQKLKDLLGKVRRNDSNLLQILKNEGDWTTDQFWAVVRFLKETSRFREVLQVFNVWKNIQKFRINVLNYEKIIYLLTGAGLMDEATILLQDMKSSGFIPTLGIYNCMIHGFAQKGEFEDALCYFKEMAGINLKPEIKTYNGLIQAYGTYRMYDEMSKCVKKMESEGCFPDHITYNLLIAEFARGGLLKRMERVYKTLLSKRMGLQASTLVAMLEGYANLGILQKMEKTYRRVLYSKIPLKGDLVRKLAKVYIKNYMYSRLEDLGLDFASRMGVSDLVWCIRLLSQACLLSRKGMNHIIQEMAAEKSSWNVTVANIIALAYLKMKDLRHLNMLLHEIQTRCVKPDIVTIGVFFDAEAIGFDGTIALKVWRKIGLLQEAVEMDTDPLVLTAFGKGHFLRSCEEMYSSLEPKDRQKKIWSYKDLIVSVLKHSGRNSCILGTKTDPVAYQKKVSSL
ncbi:PREDICTED: pentatricopeptide repeat-containing protein At4g14190, chloroplastic [Nelumbo nucifera]|uniref:Pentatricopeptide repeat-containing protein At4g14190, chloroplastic n=2 Tax=Nelumbo nucifera TaxID=4432 RepID=A0A1U8BAT7_NELNU|nr:PREDICTED: pentatricopeptide repeat-containing protein At4g14190, chloroplastic [Nelumbo nucifera]DAD46343.1 TPA_asm: hypothetical protein HUJ06_004573 [Nelumbo nucifera]